MSPGVVGHVSHAAAHAALHTTAIGGGLVTPGKDGSGGGGGGGDGLNTKMSSTSKPGEGEAPGDGEASGDGEGSSSDNEG